MRWLLSLVLMLPLADHSSWANTLDFLKPVFK